VQAGDQYSCYPDSQGIGSRDSSGRTPWPVAAYRPELLKSCVPGVEKGLAEYVALIPGKSPEISARRHIGLSRPTVSAGTARNPVQGAMRRNGGAGARTPCQGDDAEQPTHGTSR